MPSTLLVTGGAGYIGTHTLVELIAAGHAVVVLDDFSNSSPEALARVRAISGADVEFVEGDVRDDALLDGLFQRYAQAGSPIDCVLHLAASKAVGESVAWPLRYYDNNVGGTLSLLKAMSRACVNRIVFSSSATVYGPAAKLPYPEDHAIAPSNPYGWTKAIIERVLDDMCRADPTFTAICLRYFNPVGAHESGLIGESPNDIPNNLFPFITQVAIGRQPCLTVFGSDYPTVDGTGVRDYLHVSDLAVGHVKAVEYAAQLAHGEFRAINLGTGRGTSVLQMIEAFERVNGVRIPYRLSARRPGDLAEAWADPGLARRLLGWQATRDLDQMCRDGWRWQQNNPAGYPKLSASGEDGIA
jgi:UDP-glucose 4-epimerase